MINGLLTVHDSYTLFHAANPDTPFLSEYNADWWKDYQDNYDIYDRDFVRKYYNFIYFLQESPKTDAEKTAVISDFRDAVTAHLMKNSEKYRQLWRVTQVPDEKAELYENVNGTEKTITTYGKKVTSSFAAREDTRNITADPYTDTTDTSADAAQDKITSAKGAIKGTNEHKVAPYDSDTYNPESQDIANTDAVTDTDTTDTGKRHGTTKTAYAQTHSETRDNFSAHDDTETAGGSDVTEFERRGNIGVMTVDDMLDKHKNFWMQWEFYDYIFSQFCADLLMIP